MWQDDFQVFLFLPTYSIYDSSFFLPIDVYQPPFFESSVLQGDCIQDTIILDTIRGSQDGVCDDAFVHTCVNLSLWSCCLLFFLLFILIIIAASSLLGLPTTSTTTTSISLLLLLPPPPQHFFVVVSLLLHYALPLYHHYTTCIHQCYSSLQPAVSPHTHNTQRIK